MEGGSPSAPGALAQVRVMLSRSVLAEPAPSAPLAGTSRLHRRAAYPRCLRCAGAPRRPASGSGLSLPFRPDMPSSLTPGSSSSHLSSVAMPTRPSPRSERLGTPNTPAIRFTRGSLFEASLVRLFYGLSGCSPPWTDLTEFPRPPGAFTSRLPTGRSPFPSLDMTTTASGLLCWRDFHPQEWQLASLHQIRAAAEAGLPRGAILMDAGYGNDTQLRTDVTALGFPYVAGILSNTSVWAQGAAPLPPKPWSGRGRPPKLMRRDNEHQPTSVKALALALGPAAWTEIAWREGVADRLTSRFARVRVRAAHRDYWLSEPRPEEWLLIEWPEGEKEPTKYWLSTLPEDIAFERLVELAKLRGRMERDYQELKQELGLGPSEGRGWRGFHHHASLCIAAYGFLVAERVRIPPSGSAGPKLKAIDLPAGDRPRGAPDPTGAARPEFNRHHAPEAHRGPGPKPRAMSVLRNSLPQTSAPFPLVTQ